MKKSRSASAPGQNGIPYKVYKKCPRILKHLWRLLKVVWRKGKIPSCWQQAEGCFTQKEEKLENITQFRTISLLNVEGKIFFSVLARRMTSYMTGNSYVDTSVQKGRVPGFSGCVEHTSVISQLINEAKVNKKDLTVVWLDLANAYGTIPHTLIEESLKQALQRDYQELFWWNKLAVYNQLQQVYNNVATTTERNSDWMQHLRYPIRDGNEYDH